MAANTTDRSELTALLERRRQAQDHVAIEPDPIPVIPDIVIRRLPIYIRTLRDLQDQGVSSVSSEDLAGLIGVTAAQIRRDLSYFGRFGKQGKGYSTRYLQQRIEAILKLDRQWDVALSGFGSLGNAIARYRGFEPSSYRLAAIFDHTSDQIGQDINGVRVQDTSETTGTIRRLGIKIGIIAVPASAAQEVADQMVAGGVTAILNYAPVVLRLPEGVTLREIDPISALQSMTFYLED